MTPNKETGTKFEVWLELLLKRQNYQNVLRNIEFHQSRYLYRQVDLIYTLNSDLVIVEAKYSSNGPIKNKFRNGPIERKTRNGPIHLNNLIDQVMERQYFVGGNKSVIVTNSYFHDNLINAAKKYNEIFLIDGQDLTKMWKKLKGHGSINNSIKNTRITEGDSKADKVSLEMLYK